MKTKEKKSFAELTHSDGFQTFLSSIICIILGLFIGFIVLLFINPGGAVEGILTIIKDSLNYPSGVAIMKYFGSTLCKAAPLLMCSLSILFAYKTGLFNIGAAGQYCIGICVSLYMALQFKLPWIVCLLGAILAGALLAAISGFLKAKQNVNEVISGIMLNWIALYLTNMILTNVKEATSPYTFSLASTNESAILPTLGLENLFSNNKYVTIAVPLSIIIAIIIGIVLDKTKFGYEIKACGFNRDAAQYAGMNGDRNIMLTMIISGALAGCGAGFFYLTGFEQWMCSSTSVPAMGFNGIAAAFLGGLNPIGTIFSSYFIQHITSGGAYVDKTMYSSQISDLISAIIIYLCGFVGFLKLQMKKRDRKKVGEENANAVTEEDAAAAAASAAAVQAAAAKSNVEDAVEETAAEAEEAAADIVDDAVKEEGGER